MPACSYYYYYYYYYYYCRLGYRSRYRLVTGWTVRGSNPGGYDSFRTRPHQPWSPSSLLYNGYRVSFPGVKRPGRGVNHPSYLAPRLKKEQSYTPTPLLSLHGLLQGETYFTTTTTTTTTYSSKQGLY